MSSTGRNDFSEYIKNVREALTKLVVSKGLPEILSHSAYRWTDLSTLKMTEEQWFTIGYSSGVNLILDELANGLPHTPSTDHLSVPDQIQNILDRIKRDPLWKSAKPKK